MVLAVYITTLYLHHDHFCCFAIVKLLKNAGNLYGTELALFHFVYVFKIKTFVYF